MNTVPKVETDSSDCSVEKDRILSVPLGEGLNEEQVRLVRFDDWNVARLVQLTWRLESRTFTSAGASLFAIC